MTPRRILLPGRSLSRAGFTLIELMVAMLVSSIVVMGIFAFSSIQQGTSAIQSRQVKIHQALEGAMWTIGQDLRGAGVGWARLCTELRVWDRNLAKFVNPGNDQSDPNGPANATVDHVTQEAYWVLRDGIQAHWRSTGAGGVAITELHKNATNWQNSSAVTESAADSFDVIVADEAYVGSPGVFTLGTALAAGHVQVVAKTKSGAGTLDSTNSTHLAQVRQLFPPGTFFIVVRAPGGTPVYSPQDQGQCLLLQVTGDLATGGSADTWAIPTSPAPGSGSGFNVAIANIAAATTDDLCSGGVGTPCFDDWQTANYDVGAFVIPLGRLRWSRYEIDYTIPSNPYLVRYEFIDAQAGEQVSTPVAYPGCSSGTCPLPQLHLPSNAAALPRAVAIGPVIEDMQVAVACDGWRASSVTPALGVRPPDSTFDEHGPYGMATDSDSIANRIMDENTPDSEERDRDEWLGNATDDGWSPDCVFYGTGEYRATAWNTAEVARGPRHPIFRMSPQTIRVTLVGSSELIGVTGTGTQQNVGLGSTLLPAVEDRVPITQPAGASAGNREHFVLTERFSPRNLRWRDPRVK